MIGRACTSKAQPMSIPPPRKLPRQSRSKATVEAILDACAETLEQRSYPRLTTNAVAQRAGVSVGTLYQYFPNREALAGALAVRTMERLLEAMQRAVAECVAQGLEGLAATEHLLLGGLDVLVQERPVVVGLGRDAPHLFQTPATAELQEKLLHLSQEIRMGSGDKLDLPMPEADAWLIGHMVSASMLQISILDAPDARRRELTKELARLTCRMSLAPDNQLDRAKAAAA